MSVERSVTETEGGCYISLEVSPGSKKREIKEFDAWRNSVEVAVRAPPKGGKANAELEKFLSEVFGAEVKVVKGRKSRQKVVFVKLSKSDVVKKLKGLL